MSDYKYDVTVIGGGIIGAATAMRLAQTYPQSEGRRGREGAGSRRPPDRPQQRRNPLRHLLRAGLAQGEELRHRRARPDGTSATRTSIPYELCGKLIIATSEDELPRLDELYRRGTANGVPGLEMIDAARVREIEPRGLGGRAACSRPGPASSTTPR